MLSTTAFIAGSNFSNNSSIKVPTLIFVSSNRIPKRANGSAASQAAAAAPFVEVVNVSKMNCCALACCPVSTQSLICFSCASDKVIFACRKTRAAFAGASKAKPKAWAASAGLVFILAAKSKTAGIASCAIKPCML